MKKESRGKTLFLAPIIFFALGLNRIDVNQEYFRETLNLEAGVKIGQTFKAEHNNLNMIKVVGDNMKLKNEDKIIFHLRELGQEKDLAVINFNGGNIGENFVLRLQFEPIKDSAGKNFYFYLDDKESKSMTPIGFRYSEANVYSWGEAMVNDNPVAGDLFFRTYYRVSLKEGILGSLSDFQTKFLQEKGFAVSFLLGIFILGILTSFIPR